MSNLEALIKYQGHKVDALDVVANTPPHNNEYNENRLKKEVEIYKILLDVRKYGKKLPNYQDFFNDLEEVQARFQQVYEYLEEAKKFPEEKGGEECES